MTPKHSKLASWQQLRSEAKQPQTVEVASAPKVVLKSKPVESPAIEPTVLEEQPEAMADVISDEISEQPNFKKSKRKEV